MIQQAPARRESPFGGTSIFLPHTIGNPNIRRPVPETVVSQTVPPYITPSGLQRGTCRKQKFSAALASHTEQPGQHKVGDVSDLHCKELRGTRAA